ncbi:hypothetical protein [Pinirhizobacter sp.]|jgi:hypothetical protein|uniref:hypothetical protein n=1 Tax=Pinirhizobacter sp. TaxID=2950432 RepID=UPI002F4265A3
MQGPYASESVISPVPPSPNSWESRHGLVRGKQYRVVKAFVDADGDAHPVGEKWTFISADFSKFDDQIQIVVHLLEGTDWKIPLIWKSEMQAVIIEHIQSYLQID